MIAKLLCKYRGHQLAKNTILSGNRVFDYCSCCGEYFLAGILVDKIIFRFDEDNTKFYKIVRRKNGN